MKPYGFVLPSGSYIVVYPYPFEYLFCDDNRPGTLAFDLFDSKGTSLDGLTVCPRCLKSALAFAEKSW